MSNTSDAALPPILIVEDNPAIVDIYLFRLQHEGFPVKAAYDGKEGLQLAEEMKPALILLDLKMPEMSGDEMLEKLRQTDWGANIRVIVLTNISRDEAPRNLSLLGVDRYIVKAHYTPSQVTQIVHEVLGSR